MTPKTKRPAHAELERHQTRLADATVALREAEDAEREASTAEEHARDKVREAFDLGVDPTEPTAALSHAKAVAEGAVLAREGVEARVRRAEHERALYREENAETLLAELQDDSDKVVQDLRNAAEALLAADKSWRAVSATVTGHLRDAKQVPHENSNGTHGLEEIVRGLRRALPAGISSPSPHWTRREAERTEQETKVMLRRERHEVAPAAVS
jgi:hypothetical protein